MKSVLYLFSILISPSLYSQSDPNKLTITSLTKDFYIYTTFGDAGGGVMFPANGMYMVTKSGVVLFDTPWDSTEFQPLLDTIKSRHHQDVVLCISTHFHEDRTAGLNYYKQLGIKTYTTQQTDELSKIRNNPRAAFLMSKDTTFNIGQYSIETYYPGKGHSPDNIVIWIKKQKILYGGCFIKSTETESIGNLSDADIDEWINSIKKVQSKFKKPRYIIPGHQDWTSTLSLRHTLDIILNYQKKNPKK